MWDQIRTIHSELNKWYRTDIPPATDGMIRKISPSRSRSILFGTIIIGMMTMTLLVADGDEWPLEYQFLHLFFDDLEWFMWNDTRIYGIWIDYCKANWIPWYGSLWLKRLNYNHWIHWRNDLSMDGVDPKLIYYRWTKSLSTGGGSHFSEKSRLTRQFSNIYLADFETLCNVSQLIRPALSNVASRAPSRKTGLVARK